MYCPICGTLFEPYDGMRRSAIKDHPYWCKPCQDEFDNIDWEAEYYKRHN